MELVLDPVGGLAGDMWLGMLVDLGVSPDALDDALRGLELPGWTMDVAETSRRSIGCTRVVLEVPDEADHRHLPEIESLIERSGLPGAVKQTALQVFRELARAEGRVHRIDPAQVHFHEVGAADAILDICGVAFGLHHLGVERVTCGPLPAGTGTVRCAHGELPVPVPAVVELLAGRFDLEHGRGRGEMVTPTGAALLAVLGEPLSAFTGRVSRVGYGAGTRADSIVRGMLVEPGSSQGMVVVLETWIDDGHPEQLAWLSERLRRLGALEVGLSPVTTKHGRPGVRVEVLAEAGLEDRLVEAIFAETPTLGVRVGQVRRRVRERRVVTVETRWGPVRVKIAGETRSPEYADCAAIAEAAEVPLRQVYAAALAALTAGEGPLGASSRG